MSVPRSIYITLQYLRTDSNGQNKYHWGLYATGDSPPKGILFHASDEGRRPLDLFYERRNVSNPLRSRSMVVVLKIGDVSSASAIDRSVSRVPLMSRSRLPPGEPQWTCRVYVKQALEALNQDRILRLPASVNQLERACLAAADSYLVRKNAQSQQEPGVHNNLAWIGTTSRTTPMELDSVQRYPSLMEVDSTGRYGSSRLYGSQMEVDSTGRYGSSRSYGSQMEVDSTGRYGSSR
ncbi:hypothetical protein LOCC1_G006403, partial [Lachnellula occidentalis]